MDGRLFWCGEMLHSQDLIPIKISQRNKCQWHVSNKQDYDAIRKFQQTTGTYPRPSTTCLNMEILPYFYFGLPGMFQGVCWKKPMAQPRWRAMGSTLVMHSGHHDDALSICALQFSGG